MYNLLTIYVEQSIEKKKQSTVNFFGSQIFLIALTRVYVRLGNFTTKPRFQKKKCIFLPRTKSQSNKYEKNIHMQRARG